jgi:acetyltransferase-like isoleucine patch superfamily enzyme
LKVLNIVEDGVTMGENTIVWWFSRIGRGTTIGRDCMIASLCEIQENCRIGDRVRIQSGCFISSGSRIEEDVFVGPKTIFLNDRFPYQRQRLIGPTVRRGVVIGGAVTVLPEVEIGEGAVIGAHSLVNRNVPASEVWGGCPARHLMSRGEYERKRKRWLAKGRVTN